MDRIFNNPLLLFKAQKPSSQSANYMQASPGRNSPVVDSYPRNQPGFLKSAISGKNRYFWICLNFSFLWLLIGPPKEIRSIFNLECLMISSSSGILRDYAYALRDILPYA